VITKRVCQDVQSICVSQDILDTTIMKVGEQINFGFSLCIITVNHFY